MERIKEDDTTDNLQMKVNEKNNRYVTVYFFLHKFMLYSRARMRAWIMFDIT